MTTIHTFKAIPGASSPAQAPHEQMAENAISDSQALQELIDILRKPFQSNCDLCRGSGLSGRGKACSACHGTGRILIDLL